jgi:hypothetical protein
LSDKEESMSAARNSKQRKHISGNPIAVGRGRPFFASIGCVFAVLLFTAEPALSQLGERPGNSTTMAGSPPKDLSGRSIKNKRVRMVHSTDNALEGTSRYFQDRDPWLAYQRGKNLTQREFRNRDGAFPKVSKFGGELVDGFSPKIVANDQVSCAGCHNFPYREAGAGTNFAKTGGDGRNSPHFFGAGLMETIAIQIRQKMLQQMDRNLDGWVGKAEMDGATVEIRPSSDAAPIPYGRNGDFDGNGKPDLNRIFEIWYVDGAGKRLPGATSLFSANVEGYNLWPVFWGWGEFGGGLNPTNRVFIHDPFNAHTGLPAWDPTTNNDPDGDGLTGVSNAGAQQVFSHKSPEAGVSGKIVNGVTVCLDDIDGDGALEEITQGDIDTIEWYMLNAPPPAAGRRTARTERGREVFESVGCAECHVPDWYIEPAATDSEKSHDRFAGDRRFFHLETIYSETNERLEGTLVDLTTLEGGVHTPRRDGFLVRGIFTDFRHHNMGDSYGQRQFDGSLIEEWRTAPLWGVGSSGPWDHDGASFDLYSSILRHGGSESEAASSVTLFKAASEEDREALIAFLSGLVLYQVEELPCDIDGDGQIGENFMVAGKNVGTERLNAEFLFETPVEIEGEVLAPDGTTLNSLAVMNVDEAYGQDLAWIADRDDDGWPDVMDGAPDTTGYLDGKTSVPVFLNSDLNGDGAIDATDLLMFRSVWQGGSLNLKGKARSPEEEPGPSLSTDRGLMGRD